MHSGLPLSQAAPYYQQACELPWPTKRQKKETLIITKLQITNHKLSATCSDNTQKEQETEILPMFTHFSVIN